MIIFKLHRLAILFIILFSLSIHVQAGTTDNSSAPFEYGPGIIVNNGPDWIYIDPVSSRFEGERFNITGKTNLPANEEIIVEILTVPPRGVMETGIGFEKYYVYETFRIKESLKPGNDTFSIPVNLSGKVPSKYSHSFKIRTRNYSIYIADFIIYPGEIRKDLDFFRPVPDQMNNNPTWLLLDQPCCKMYENGSYYVTGTTSLSIGETIPYTLDLHYGEEQEIETVPEYGYVVSAIDDEKNKFIINFDSSIGNPKSYFLTVWNPYYNESFNNFLSASVDISREDARYNPKPDPPKTAMPTKASLPFILPLTAIVFLIFLMKNRK